MAISIKIPLCSLCCIFFVTWWLKERPKQKIRPNFSIGADFIYY